MMLPLKKAKVYVHANSIFGAARLLSRYGDACAAGLAPGDPKERLPYGFMSASRSTVENARRQLVEAAVMLGRIRRAQVLSRRARRVLDSRILRYLAR